MILCVRFISHKKRHNIHKQMFYIKCKQTRMKMKGIEMTYREFILTAIYEELEACNDDRLALIYALIMNAEDSEEVNPS